ncbi:MAG: enoyl-CoA hydratase/isomerase family protein [Planctomycetaceae bacterium]|nr:enoyl-CoA hydratase/isomerase family protein [Planctomycetaceae bacterium]
MKTYKTWTVDVNDKGVMTAVLDLPDHAVNVFNSAVLTELNEIVEAATHQLDKVRMLVFRSGKESGFLAGADIHRIERISSREEAEAILEQGQKLFNMIAKLPIPTVAVINGPCVGGGLEFAMACKYRLAVNDGSTKLGLPEVKLGLIPAWGGTQRLPKLIGMSNALPMMLEGKLIGADKAYRLGLVDGLLSSTSDDVGLRAFIDARLGRQPLAKTKRSWTRWMLDATTIGRKLVVSTARKRSAKMARHYPALARIIEATAIGASSTDVSDSGLRAERDAFQDLLFGSVAPELIRLFLLQEQAKKSSVWTDGAEGVPVRKLAVIGAGTMGAGIAQLAASRGLDVVLQDIEQRFVDRGMETIRELFKKAVRKKALSQEDADAALAHVTPRVGWDNKADLDLMIEAVIEQPKVKQEVFRAADESLPLHAVLASNTSALPIDDMATATARPEKVAGLHFFNPVHKMPLVEVVRTGSTSEGTIATLVNVAKKLGKTPIVVRQSPGFLVNRILFPYLDEAARMVLEGVDIREIDKAAKKFGMPMGPVELLDVVGLDIAADVSETLTPLATEDSPAPGLFQMMVAAGHRGQKSGQGFYHWKDGRREAPVEIPDLVEKPEAIEIDDWKVDGEVLSPIQQRLVLAMLNESTKVLAEGVVEEPRMVDLGMVLGTGFAPFRGGPMQCLKRWGPERVRERLEHLAEHLGPRFRPCQREEHSQIVSRIVN